MKATSSPRFLAISIVLLGGCTDVPFDPVPEGSTGSDGTTAAVESSTGDGPATTTATTTTSEPATDSTVGFEESGSTGDPPPGNGECDVWAQDCAEGEKCVPWADDGGTVWNAVRCVPVMGDGQPGDTCTLGGGGEITGIDDCALGSICMRLDDGTDNGLCVPQCMGSEEAPTCADDDRTCMISNDGVMTLCMEMCDPILQDCPSGMGCYPFDPYVCWPDFSGEIGAYGDICMYGNGCNPGLLCTDGAAVPGCEGDYCCTEYCDLTQPDPNAQCSGQAGGQVCEPLVFAGGPEPGLEHVGVCTIPA